MQSHTWSLPGEHHSAEVERWHCTPITSLTCIEGMRVWTAEHKKQRMLDHRGPEQPMVVSTALVLETVHLKLQHSKKKFSYRKESIERIQICFRTDLQTRSISGACCSPKALLCTPLPSARTWPAKHSAFLSIKKPPTSFHTHFSGIATHS